MNKQPSPPTPPAETAGFPIYIVAIRKAGGQAKDRFHTRDRATAVDYYQRLLPTGGWMKILIVREGDKRTVIQTTRYENDKPITENGDGFEGFDWTPPQRGPSLRAAHQMGTQVRFVGDPTKPHDAERRAEILRSAKAGQQPPPPKK